MHIFIELWQMNARWQRLDAAARGKLMADMAARTGPVIAAGAIEVLGWGFADAGIDHPASHQLFAVWRAPSAAAIAALAQAIGDGGWYDYADQVNVAGLLQPPEAVIGQLIGQEIAA